MMLPVTALVQQCAPFVAPKTMAAIVRVESGGNPLVMYNDTNGQRIVPPNRQQARVWLATAMALGQSVDVGIAQVNTANFAAYGLTPDNAFDACTNLRVGARILAADYRKASAVYGPGQQALYHAFEAYNSGRLAGDSGYADRVLAAAGIPVQVSAGGSPRYHPLPQTPFVFAVSWVLADGKAPAGSKAPVDKTSPGSEQRSHGSRNGPGMGPFSLRW